MRVAAKVSYHIHSTERQSILFDVDGEYGNIVFPELSESNITAEDLRNNLTHVNFKEDGISFKNSPTKIKDFIHSSDWEETYNNEIEALLSETINAKEVIVFDHTIRVDEPDQARQPARHVHNDYTAIGAEQRMIDVLGDQESKRFLKGHYGLINTWRPIENPIKSSPLGFIHPNSIVDEDWMTIYLDYPDDVREISGVAANHKHEWFYVSNMTLDEVVIFNTYDNNGHPHLAHSAIDIDAETNIQTSRKSIESRAIVLY